MLFAPDRVADAPSEQGFRACLGVLRLYRGLAPARVEPVPVRAMAIDAFTSESIASIIAEDIGRTALRREMPQIIDRPDPRGAGCSRRQEP